MPIMMLRNIVLRKWECHLRGLELGAMYHAKNLWLMASSISGHNAQLRGAVGTRPTSGGSTSRELPSGPKRQ